MKKRNNKKSATTADSAGLAARRKKMEALATFGLILIAVALLAPFASFLSGGSGMVQPGEFSWISVYKWVYAAGALIFTAARIVNVNDPKDSMRVRRLRRMEFWAGMAFCIGAFFWFYNTQIYGEMKFKDTVTFSLVGAMLQVISSFMIAWRQKKEAQESSNEKGK
ncbi:MAG: hypothetical protein K2L35_04660 [Muribaculaceae bacterium]|nr:hypothetical protein [Muribaculaceae bacterium]